MDQDKLFARTNDGQLHEVVGLEFARTNPQDETEGAVVLTFADGTRQLARECEQVNGR
jgi:formylmethanofuran dehydrogenase subunit E-like metal-binding protein